MSDTLFDVEGEEEIHPLAATDADVARMTRPQREARLDLLIADSRQMLDDVIAEHVTADGRQVAGIVVLFSGGNDSTALAHLFRDRATHVGHANTTVGIEDTREFVRQTCASWGLPLIEKMPPRLEDRYRTLVLNTAVNKDGEPLGGFPGPAMHWKMWNRLKERGLEAVKAELITHPYRQRVVFVAGRRRAESQRRAKIPLNGRRRTTVWVSPLIHWTKPDLNTYRLRFPDIPTNRASALIHMSGECLCGSFASPGERDEIDYWFPMALDDVRELEAILQGPEYAHIPPYRKVWGWGADPTWRVQAKAWELERVSGGLCESCDDRGLLALPESAEEDPCRT